MKNAIVQSEIGQVSLYLRKGADMYPNNPLWYFIPQEVWRDNPVQLFPRDTSSVQHLACCTSWEDVFAERFSSKENLSEGVFFVSIDSLTHRFFEKLKEEGLFT